MARIDDIKWINLGNSMNFESSFSNKPGRFINISERGKKTVDVTNDIGDSSDGGEGGKKIGSIFELENWQQFLDMAKMIAELMGVKDTSKLIDNITNTFKDIGGSPEAGYKNIQIIDEILKNTKLANTTPPIKAQDFLNQMIKTESRYEKASITTFLNLIKTRTDKRRTLENKLKNAKSGDNLKIGDILKDVFKYGENDMAAIYNVFHRMFNMNNYKKNGGAIGKGEIAMVMFFGDCEFPEGEGDIQIKDSKIELKTDGAVITDRFMSNDINVWWSDVKDAINEKDKDIETIWRDFGLKDVEPKFKDATYRNILAEKFPPKKNKITQAERFLIWFSATFFAYAETFNKMVLINSDKNNSKAPLENSKTFISPLVIIDDTVMGRGNWLQQGYNVLNYLTDKGIKIRYETREAGGNGGFKAYFSKQ